MKVKKIENKLALNKLTIANLGTDAMHKVQGGAVTVTAYCYSCNDSCNTKYVEECTMCCTESCHTVCDGTCASC